MATSACVRSLRGRVPGVRRVAAPSGRRCARVVAAPLQATASSSGESVAERRTRESARVEELAKAIETQDEFEAALALAGDHLVICEMFSDEACELGDGAFEAAPTWNDAASARDAIMAPCRRLANTISRVARECDEVEFITIDAEMSDETEALARSLGAKVMPTVQFYKNGDLIYQVNGVAGADRAIGEGALFLGNQGAGGEHVSDFIQEVSGKAGLVDYIAECSLPGTGPGGVDIDVPCEKQLSVLDVSMAKGHPACMHAFPAVVAMAKNTQGAVRWGRLLGDSNEESKALMDELNVTAVPTFIFYCDGKEVGRYVGSDRVQLMQAVLKNQRDSGILLPEPPPRKRMSIADARAIKEEKRSKARAAGARPAGW